MKPWAVYVLRVVLSIWAAGICLVVVPLRTHSWWMIAACLLPGLYFLVYFLLLIIGLVRDLLTLERRGAGTSRQLTLNYRDPGTWMVFLFLRLMEVVLPTPKTAYVAVQKRATLALLKFCEQHDCDGAYSNLLRECASLLEKNDITKAVETYKKIGLGPHGFADWFPPVVYSHEDGDYVWATFEALVERWARLMSLSEAKRG